MARKIEVEITGDSRSLERALGKAQKSSGHLGGAFRKLGYAAAAGAAALTAFAVIGTVKAIDAASDLSEAINKASVVFGKQSKVMLKWADTTATAFGISKRAALEASAGFGAMFLEVGQAPKAAAKFSRAFVKAAADLGSFFNADPTQVLEDLRSGLAGEAEPLRKFNIFMNEATTKAYAYKHGIAQTGKELTENQKILARQGFILEHIGKASDDFAETSDGVANQQRILKAQIENTSAAIGQAFLPVVAKVLQFVNDSIPKLSEFGSAVSEKMAGPLAGVADAVTSAWPRIQGALRGVWAFVQKNLIPIALKLKEIWHDAIVAIAGVLEKHRPELERIWKRVGSVITNLSKVILPALRFFLTKVLPKAIGVAITAVDKISAAIERVVGWVKSAIEWIKDLIDWFQKIPDLNPFRGGGSGGTPEAPGSRPPGSNPNADNSSLRLSPRGGGNGGGASTVVLKIGERELGRALLQMDQNKRRQTGGRGLLAT